MTDKNVLERLKGWIKESKKSGFPMLRADVAYIFFDELIQEVERLRVELAGRDTVDSFARQETIESLTKELEEQKRKNQTLADRLFELGESLSGGG